MKRLIYIVTLFILLNTVILTGGCSRHSDAWPLLCKAESIIENHPDSAYNILLGIDKSCLAGDAERAKYALLMAMALDKNYIDTTEFDVIQPAVDYYLTNGTPDEKLKTYYYQGVVFLNRNDDENAMAAFLKAEQTPGCIDSLALARVYITMAAQYYKQFMIKDFTYNSLKAADIYVSHENTSSALNAYAKALNGYVILQNKDKADSIYNICKHIISDNPEQETYIDTSLLSYTLFWGNDTIIKESIENITPDQLDLDLSYQIANGYIKLGLGTKAIEYLDRFPPNNKLDSLSYFLRKSNAYMTIGNIPEAFRNFKIYQTVLTDYQTAIFNHSMKTVEKRYENEISHLIEKQSMNKKLLIMLSILIAIILISGVLLYLYQSNKKRRFSVEKENQILKIEQTSLKQNKASLLTKNQSLQLEKKNLTNEINELVIENNNKIKILENQQSELKSLTHQLAQFKAEYNNLQNILKHNSAITEPLIDVIRKRMDILNGLFVKEISKSYIISKRYDENINKLIENRDEFLSSTRLLFLATSPHFIEHLEASGLTDDEINISCLLAMGLSGKEAGNYVATKSYYNISSTIRKKLAIPDNASHLGSYLKKWHHPTCETCAFCHAELKT